MKINKSIFICALLVLVMLCVVSTASAEESLNENLTATDTGGEVINEITDEPIAVSNSEAKLSASGDTITVSRDGTGDYDSISAAVGAANGGETIYIKNGEYTESGLTSVKKQLTFTGESRDGVIIKTTGTTGFLSTTESGYTSLTFNNLTFVDVHTTGSNAVINIGGNGMVTIADCTFDNCDGRYGALRVFTSGDFLMENSKFLNTKSSQGSYSSAIDFGGSSSTYTVKNTIIDNSSIAAGGAAYIFGAIYCEKSSGSVLIDNLTISNCDFAANALITNKGKMNISNSRFVNNRLFRDNQYAALFAMNTGNARLTVETSIIANNTEPNYFVATSASSSVFDFNYNNIQDNSFKLGYVNAALKPDLDANYWGSNSLPEGIDASTWIVNNNGNYEMNTGEALDVIIPGLNDIPSVPIYVSNSGSDDNDGLTKQSAVKTIQKAIELAEDGKIIILDDYTINQTITINKDLEISGEGSVTIDGNQMSVFENNANLVLSNLAFTNAKAANGVVLKDNGNSTITGCTFYANRATSTSGGNIVNNVKGTMTIENSKFYENVASRGAVASQSATTLNVRDCEFYSNDMTSLSTTYGMIYSASATTVVENTVFRDNKVKSGGAIYATRTSSGTTGTLEVINCTFDNNTANQGTGGAIFAGRTPTSISDSTFTNNKATNGDYAKGQGGAVYQSIDDTKSQMTIENCIFINNTADDAGAAAYVNTNQGTFDITNSVIINKEGDDTYAIDKKEGATTVITAEDNLWGNNTFANIPGFEDESKITMDAVYTPVLAQAGEEITITVTFSKSIPNGIEVKFESTSGNLDETVVTDNAMASIRYTLDANDTEIIITSAGNEIRIPVRNEVLDVVYVSPNGKDSNLGTEDSPVKSLDLALQLAGKGQIVLLEGTYKTGDLGSVYSDLNITGKGKVIIDAQNDNRILYVGSEANVVLKNLILINGYSASESGALLGNSGKLTIINCTLANSTSAANGGAIYSVGQLTITDSVIDSNTATLGGAIYADKYSTYANSLIIENTVFSNNVAKANADKGGAAIYAQALTGTFTVSNATFKGNKVEGAAAGGAIYTLQLDSDVEISDSYFVNNTANPKTNYGGGAICFIGGNYQKQGSLKITGSQFEDNYASLGGGAVFVRGSTLNIANSAILNSCDDDGIAVYKGDTSYVSAAVTANNNWWGTNDDPKSFTNGVAIASWAIMTVTNSSELKEGETVLLTVAIDSYTTGTENGTLDAPIKVTQPVIIETNLGEIEGNLKDGQYALEYTVPSGLKYMVVTVGDANEVPYFVSTETTIEISDVVAKKGEIVEFNVSVVTDDGTTVSRGNVEIYMGDDLIATVAVNDGKASQKIRINNDEGIYNITAKFSDESSLFLGSNKTSQLTVSGLNNIVTKDNFFDFFDESGVLLKDVPFDELTFKGEFSDLNDVNVIYIENIAVTGDEAVLNNISIAIIGDNVKLSNIKFISDKTEFDDSQGAVILVYGADNVVLDGVDIAYTTPDDVTAYGIYILDSSNVNVTDSKITFDSNNYGEAHTYALHIRDSNDVLVKGNLIDALLPSLNVDFSYWGSIDTDLVLAVGIQAGKNVQLIENNILSNVKSSLGGTATLDTIMVYGTKNLLISHNNITETDFSGVGVAGYSNVVDLYSFEDATIEYNNIYVKTTTGVEGAGTAYPIQLTGPYSGLVIDHNNLTAIAGGPALGIYSQNYYGNTDITVTNNFINVTGLATGDYYALVSGMELQDTNAKVYNNTIYSYNVGDGTEGLFGISYAQDTMGSHTYDIQNNTIYTEGKYAIYLKSARSSTVTGNILYASELKGDEAVKIGGGSGNIVIDNCPPFPADVVIDVEDCIIGFDNLVTVTVTNATGNVTIRINENEYEIDLDQATASILIPADKLNKGENLIEVTYNGNDYYRVTSANATFNVLDGVITNETYSSYFDESGNLKSFVPDGATLDFQGKFIGKYTVKINKSVNVISSTGDAVFDSGATYTSNAVNSFNIVAGGNHTNITGLSLINTCLYIQGASYVTVDGINIRANKSGVGSGTGFLSIHSNAYYTTVKNCKMENGGTGSSLLVLGKGGKYATFDNNVLNITGSSGNVLSSNVFVGTGENPEFVNYTNNIIYSNVGASSTMYGITVCGQGNIIENNTLLNFKGNGIINQYGATSTKNIYRNNIITGGGSMAIGTYSIVENNYIAEGSLTVTEGCTFINNTAKALTVSGKNVVAQNNTVLGTVTFNSAAQNTTFTNNHVAGLLTVNSNNNVITENQISSSADYAVDLKSTSNNVVQYNKLSSADKMGDDAVKFAEGKNNNVSDNGKNAIVEIDVADSWIGNNNTVIVSVINGTGNVTLKVNDIDYGTLALDNGKAIFEIDAADIVIGLNDVTATYNGDEEISSEWKDTTFYGVDNVVFKEVFYQFFDSEGVLKEDVPYDELIFRGAFSGLTRSITINRPLRIVSDGASLSQIGINITSSDVAIDGLTLTTTTNSVTSERGNLIDVNADDVTLSNLVITYKVTSGDHDAVAINVRDADNVKVLNNTITFESRVSSDEYTAIAINLDGVTNSVIDNNKITSTLPAVGVSEYDLDYFMMGLSTINPVKIRESEGINFTNNNIDAKVYKWGTTTPTAQSLVVVGCENVLIDSNVFRMVDTKAKSNEIVYLYAINLGYDKQTMVSNNNFVISTTGGKDASGTAYALQIVESELDIIANNITTSSNGPNLGIYSSTMWGTSSELYIADNTINVTGYASSSDSYALLSGIEITVGNAKIYNNTIYVHNKAGYVETAPVYGVSYAQQMTGSRSVDIKDNEIFVNGKYTVSLLSGTNGNVIGNILYAEELSGDDSVAPGIEGIVKDNFPTTPEITVVATNVFEGTATRVSVNVPGATGNVTIKVNGKEYPVELIDGEAIYEISDYGEDYTVNVTYDGDLKYYAGWNVTTFRMLDNVVEEDIFFDYFDEDGVLRQEVPFDNLIFKGNFTKPVDYIIIDRPVIITGQDAVLNEMGFVIVSEDVKLEDLTLIATSSLGNLITVWDSNEICNLNITYIVDDEEAAVIYVREVMDVTISNNDIYFESHVTSDESVTSAIALYDAENVIVDNNRIDVNIPALEVETYDMDYFMMGLVYANPVIMYQVTSAKFTNNELNVEVNDYGASYPTIQALYIVGSEDVLIESNNITMKDEITPAGTAIYLYGVESGKNDELVFRNNNFNINTTGGKNGAGSAYALQFVQTNAEIIANNITCESNGPNLAIYLPMGMGRAGNVLVQDNNIEVIGLASSTSNYALVSGIEAQTGYLKVYNNTISTINKYGTYNEKFNVYGVSFAQTGARTLSFDVQDNEITTNGHYAVAFNYAISNNIVKGNRLITADLYGDDSVYIKSGENVVEDNWPFNPQLTVSADNITIGQDAKINVSIDKHATGNIIVIADGKRYTLAADGDDLSIAIPNLGVGKYTVTVTYAGDEKVLAGENSTVFEVSKIDSPAIISVGDINIGEDVPVNITIEGATGEVTVIVDGNKKVLPLENGVAKFTMNAISAGNHSISVVYMGDSTHKLVVNSTEFAVEKIATEIGLADINLDAGQAIPINFTIGPDATGKVMFNINGSKFFEDLQNGGIDIFLDSLAPGVYTMSISYQGDAKYAESDKTVQITIAGFDAELKANASDIKVGEDAVIDISINENVTGKTTVTLNDKVIRVTFTEGKASIKVSDLANGTYTAVVKFAGDNKFLADEVNVTFTVSKEEMPSEINITTDIPEGTTSPEFTITLPPNATGNFTVYVNGTPYTAELVNGSATVKVPDQVPGDYIISTEYSGDDKYDGYKSDNSTFTIPKASIPGGEDALNMTSPEGSSTPSYTINLPPEATGELKVVVDGKDTYSQALVNGSATVTVPELASGKHNITVSYTGDDKFSSISKDTTVNVNAVNTTISAPKVTATYGVSKKLVITLKDVDGNVLSGKTVTVKVGSISKTLTTNDKGQVSVAVSNMVPKTYTATFKFEADSKYAASSGTAKVVVKKAKSKITAKKKTFKAKKKVKKYTITLKAGKKPIKKVKVTLKVKGKTYKAKTNKKGKATFKIKKLTKRGKFKAVVKFKGNKYYKAASKKVKITVKK